MTCRSTTHNNITPYKNKTENTQPESFPNVKLYGSDPWTASFLPTWGNICNIKIDASKTSGM